MNTIIRSSALRGLLAAAILGGTCTASSSVSAAGTDTNSESQLVTFADLKISSAAGATELYARINAAAVSVCSYFWFKSDADEARCIGGAIANAVAEVNEPALVAVYNLKNRKPLPSLKNRESQRASRVASSP